MNQTVKIVIVGGVAGGMSAATRARRCNEDAQITVLERGSYISFANCGLPYYLDGRIAPKEKLLLTHPGAVASRYKIDARVGQEVMTIDRPGKRVQVKDLLTSQTYWLAYDKLILAPGANAIVPPLPNIDARNVFGVRSVDDIVAIEAYIQSAGAKSVVIVGAGYIGLEMADAMTSAGLSVTLLEKAADPMPMMDHDLVSLVREELQKHNVGLITGDGLAALNGDGDRVREVVTESGRRLPADLVILSIGVRPNVSLAQSAGLQLGVTGAIQVDGYQRTSDPDIYAVGDAAEVTHGVTGLPARIPLAGSANRAGRLAGQHSATGQSPAAGKVLGTAIVQVFDLAAGMTGLSESAAIKAGFDADSAYVLPTHHAGYYPDAQQMRLKLVYDKPTGRILGAAAVGKAGVDKRIDVIATVMHFGGTIDDLAQLDLAYSPQYGSAKDAVHFAAFVAQNQRDGFTPAVNPRFEVKDRFVLDVRTPGEYAKGAMPGAINIPVDELRGRLGELPKDRAILVTCQVGMRGHIATRILRQRGFDAVNLKGGYLMATASR